MTLILIISFLLIAFIGLLRYDIHKHKHSEAVKEKQLTSDTDNKSKTG
jgi:hypothetical protein